MVEQSSNGHSLRDYKFFCFNGKVKFLYVASERDVEVKFDFFDPNWNWINVKNYHENMEIHPSKPSNLAEMITVAEILSQDFPFVRVDLYNVNGQVKFGEMTFYHMAGLEPFVPESYDRIFGEYFCEIFKNCEKTNN